MSQRDTGSNRESLDALLDAAVDAIVIIGSEGEMLRFNPAAERLFGFAETEVLGENVSLLMPQPDRRRHDRYIQRHRESGERTIIGIGREVTARHRDGSRFPIHLSVGEINTSASPGYVGIIRDLTSQRQIENSVHELEQQLAHADRLVMLGELMAGIAHEINQPLTAIAAYADAGERMLESLVDDQTSELCTVCKRISEQARRAAEVVRRLRTLSRKGTVQKASVDVISLVKKVFLIVEYNINKYDITIDMESAETVPSLFLDEIQVQQVLVNLISNAVDALSTMAAGQGRIVLRVLPGTDAILIQAEDNGPGIPTRHRSRLFEPFFTTKAKGVGLGLSICRNIARAHGGDLVFEPVQPHGARFVLSLPLEHIG